MDDVGGPRDHLADERTDLAWLRTSLAVIVLGLAIAKFGDQGTASASSVTAGYLLMLAGTAVATYGSIRYRATARELSQQRVATPTSTTGPIVTAAILLLTLLAAGAIILMGS